MEKNETDWVNVHYVIRGTRYFTLMEAMRIWKTEYITYEKFENWILIQSQLFLPLTVIIKEQWEESKSYTEEELHQLLESKEQYKPL